MYESFVRYNITQMGFNVVYRVYFYLEFKRNFGYFFRIFEDFFRNFEISLEFWIFPVIFSLRTSLEILGPSLEILGLLFGICPIVFGHFFFYFGTFFRKFFFLEIDRKKILYFKEISMNSKDGHKKSSLKPSFFFKSPVRATGDLMWRITW